MRIRVARRMYGQFVAAGKGACCGELINPVSEVRGEPPYRTVFTVNPMENFEISEVLVSEEDMEKIQQLKEVLINVNGEVLARRKDGNTPTLEYYLTKVQTRYVEHKGSLLDFRKENIQITKKRVRRTDGVRARNRILEHGFRRSHPRISIFVYSRKPKSKLAQARKVGCRNEKLPDRRSKHQAERISGTWDVGVSQ